MAAAEQTLELDVGPVFVRRAEAPDPVTPPALFLHTVPTSSDDLLALLERCGGVAPDLPGFGRSSKAGHLDYTPSGQADFIAALLGALELEHVSLVAHGWGAAGGLAFAERHPEKVSRIVLLNPLPLFTGFHWGRLGRTLRTPVLGEIAMGSVNRRWLGRLLRRGVVTDGAFSDAEVERFFAQFDQGTQRAILRMFRAADPAALADAGTGLGSLAMPALVVWGERDPWLESRFADAYVARLADASLVRLPDAGHWPWRDEASVIERVASFLGE
ncbi:MAG: alpha/beta fold hydrolase [Solirubrobacteraceae bacterium]